METRKVLSNRERKEIKRCVICIVEEAIQITSIKGVSHSIVDTIHRDMTTETFNLCSYIESLVNAEIKNLQKEEKD